MKGGIPIKLLSRHVATRTVTWKMPAFASSMPRSTLALKNCESLVLQTEHAPHLQRSSLVPPNSEPGSKELRKVVGYLDCKQPQEPKPRWCSVAVAALAVAAGAETGVSLP